MNRRATRGNPDVVVATPLLDQGVRITLRFSSAGAGVPSARLETAHKKRPDEPSGRLPIQQTRRLDIQAFNLCALRESESFSSTTPVLITGPQGLECPVLFTVDPEPAMDYPKDTGLKTGRLIHF